MGNLALVVMKNSMIAVCVALLALGAFGGDSVPASDDPLKSGFRDPPNRAKPRVWWHWMNGNVSKEGITADLEAMASAGIGGAHVFDVGCGVPSGPVKFATPSWDDHLTWAIREAERLGLELTLVNCSGYANAGGPWIAPSNSMFFTTHSETVVKGGERFCGTLPRETKDNGFYRDIATVAFPRPRCETDVPTDLAVTSPAKNVFVFSASRPYALRGLEFAVDLTNSWAWCRAMALTVETSADGKTWTKSEPLKFTVMSGGKCDCDIAKGFSRLAAFGNPRTAQYMRFTADLSEGFCASKELPSLAFLKPVFRCALPELNDRVFRSVGCPAASVRATTADEAVDPAKVVDLTDRMRPDGLLDWTPPAGNDWIVIRLGYLANGVQSHPCSEFGGGLEVDKLDPVAVAKQLDAYALKYAHHKSVVSVLCDSYEVGSQNWTHGFERQFKARKGYSIVPTLAVALSGRVLGSMQKTDAELADFRRVIADLFAENFAGTFAKKCAEHGLTAALEPYGNGPFDDTAYAWRATQPMTEFWVDQHVGAVRERSGHYCLLAKEVASAAHLRGIATVDAEGFTAFPGEGGRWTKDPFGLKAMGDLMYAHGVSRMVYHRWAHQPWTSPARLPGMTMGQWGTHFERTETWWPMVGPWLTYQARCQYLLQEGSFVADVLVFAGDDVPRRNLPKGTVPGGVDWDLCGRDALAELKVVDGRLKCHSETTYAMLLIPTNVTVSAESGARIFALRRAGAKIVSAVPSAWKQDFFCTDPKRELVAQHRRYARGREGYFVAYPSTNAATVTCSFRVSGKVPSLWNPETGRIARPPAWRSVNAASLPRTEVTIPFKPCGAVFVMFEPQEDKSAEPPEDVNAKFSGMPVAGPWKVTFPVGWYTDSTATKNITLDRLVDWTTLADPDLKYFSGIATYRFDVPEAGIIDFGDVRNVAEVVADGKVLATLWRPPYRCAVPKGPIEVRVANLWPNRLIGDEQLKPDCEWSDTTLKTIPDWVSKGQPSPTGRHTFTTWHHWSKTDALLPSGLLGPVSLHCSTAPLLNCSTD